MSFFMLLFCYSSQTCFNLHILLFLLCLINAKLCHLVEEISYSHTLFLLMVYALSKLLEIT